jgi:formylglycine-generating enzyme required for sulfatase activity
MSKILSFLNLILLLSTVASANNLVISNVTTPSNNQIAFEITWDNSWWANAPSNNWDGVWIFVKTQVCGVGSSPWQHADVRTFDVDHSVSGTITQVNAVSDGKGVFIRRAAVGGGSIPTTTVTLRFSNTYATASTNYEVFGIEMVNVPSGSFTIGDGSTTISQSHFSFGSNNSTPFTITSEASLAQDALRNDNSGHNTTAHAAVIAGFPKGFNSFYIMKYEITQAQYAGFLNTLEFIQQGNRMAASPSSTVGTRIFNTSDNRNSLEIKTAGVAFSTPAVIGNDLDNDNIFDEAEDGGNIACNYLSWDDLRAYLDWAGLRPMTELEFEKACRGTNSPVNSEYAWGTTSILTATSASISNGGQPSEVSTASGNGLCAHNGGSSTSLGPLRVGFAATGSTDRIQAGSGFYGIFDLSGNLWEQCYQIGWFNGSIRTSVPTFTGVLGNGALDANGNSDATNWGGGTALSVVRGGNWENTAQRCQVSDRFNINTTTENNTRVRRTGGRGVR